MWFQKQIHVFFIPEKPVQTNGINENYLTVGVGTVICVLLIVILVKLSMKSRSGKRKVLNEQRRNVNKIRDGSSIQHHHGEVEEYTEILSSQHLSHLYQPVDAVYHEIDECMELMVTPFSLKADNDSEGQTVPMTFTDATSLEKISNDSNVQTSDLFLLPIRNSTN